MLSSARERLQSLEQSQAGKDPVQKDLFSLPSETEPQPTAAQSAALAALSALDPDELSPKAALAALYALKDALNDRD